MSRISVFTLFPGLIEAHANTSVLGRAQAQDRLVLRAYDLRSHGVGVHKSVDDSPFGGGPGMVLSPEPVFAAVESRLDAGEADRPIFALGPGGRRFDQAYAHELADLLAASGGFSLLCGRYEGFDQRVHEHLTDGEISLGDFVLGGGEVAAMAIVEAVARLVPGVMGNEESGGEESFGTGAGDALLEYPQYTRPATFRGWPVPEVLRSGNHAKIARWREVQAMIRTARDRPDLWARHSPLTKGQRKAFVEFDLEVPTNAHATQESSPAGVVTAQDKPADIQIMTVAQEMNTSLAANVQGIMLLTGNVQNYAWGSKSLLPEFLGSEPDGLPQAELWLGAHPVLPSTVGDMNLERAIADNPLVFLGPRAQSDAASLPFLLKVMAVESPLSIQVHPSKAQAEAGFLAEESAGVPRDASSRNFRDANHKPEIICALTEFSLLCGFAEDRETHDRMRVIRANATDPARAVLDTVALPDGTRERRREMLRTILAMPREGMAVVVDAVRAAAPALRLNHLVAIADHYPTDPGVVVAAMMNHRVLQPQETMFFDAGTTHAYLHGLGIELLANSDNVVRCGLTPKHIDVDELLRICNPDPSGADLVEPVRDDDALTWSTGCTDFELSCVGPNSSGPAELGVDTSPRIVLCTSGSVVLQEGPEPTAPALTLDQGMAAWVFPNVDLRVTRKVAGNESSVYVARSPQLQG